MLTTVLLHLDPTPGHVLFFWVTSPALSTVFWWHYCPNWHNYQTTSDILSSPLSRNLMLPRKKLKIQNYLILSEIFSNQKTTKYFKSCCFCTKVKDYIKDLPPVSDPCKLIALFIVNASCYYLNQFAILEYHTLTLTAKQCDFILAHLQIAKH